MVFDALSNAFDVEAVEEHPPKRFVQEGVSVAPAFLSSINVDSAGDPCAVDVSMCLWGKSREVVHLLRVSGGTSGLSWVSLWEEQRGDSNSAGYPKPCLLAREIGCFSREQATLSLANGILETEAEH